MKVLTAFWTGFKAVSLAIGNVVGRVFLTIFYFAVMSPFAMIVRTRLDPLQIKSSRRGWHNRPEAARDLSAARQQY